jgi:hypothetical protein
VLTRFLDWYFSTDDPHITVIRTLVRQNAALRFTARALLGAVRGIAAFPRRIVRSLRLTLFAVTHPRSGIIMIRTALRPSFNAKTRAIAGARAIGGALSLSELEEIWTAGASCRRVLCVADEPEFLQVAALLRSRKQRVSVAWFDPETKQARGASWGNDYDLVVVGDGCEPGPRFADALDSGSIIRLGGSTPRSGWGYRSDLAKPYCNRQSGASSGDALSSKIERGEPINVLLFSDIGFQYGAGIGLRRQASSLLLNGWNVRVAAWTPGNATHQPPVTGLTSFDNWQGVVPLSSVARGRRRKDPVEVVRHEVEEWNPDVVITGNLHGTDWPLELLARLRSPERLLVAYMHDAYWATGRCAYPGTCTMFKTGCTSACPTPNEYPRLLPEQIPDAWAQRDQLFRGPGGVPLVANSRWTQGIVKQRFGEAALCDVVPLALDHHVFAPLQKAAARRLLDLPQDKALVAMGAVDLNDKRKGGPLFRGLYQALLSRGDVGVLLFGAASREFESEKSFGLIDDERLIPLIYSAADIYIGTAVEEAFGQTLLESSACGLPVVAFNVGGVSDVIVHGETGLLIDHLAVEPMLAAIDHLIMDSSKREGIGRNGRRRVEGHFTLTHQADAWLAYISRLSESRPLNREGDV